MPWSDDHFTPSCGTLPLIFFSCFVVTFCSIIFSYGTRFFFFRFFHFPQVYPYKTKVCRALAESVDDKKRLVRKEAVKCRNEW